MVNKQDFLNAIYEDIEMVRGDTLAFNFQVQGLGEEEPEAINFRCSETYNDAPLFTASLGDGIILQDYDAVKDIRTYGVWIDPDKTAYMEIAIYYYDLAMGVNDDYITLMRGRLNLLYEVPRG